MKTLHNILWMIVGLSLSSIGLAEDRHILKEPDVGIEVGPVSCTIDLIPVVNVIGDQLDRIEGVINGECAWGRQQSDWEQCGRSARFSADSLRREGEKLKERLASCAACLNKPRCTACPLPSMDQEHCGKAKACAAALPGGLDAAIQRIIEQAINDISGMPPIDRAKCERACKAASRLYSAQSVLWMSNMNNQPYMPSCGEKKIDKNVLPSIE